MVGAGGVTRGLRLAGTFQDFFRFEYRAALAIGLGTQLGGTWQDGAELSTGQWQRIALARGFMRDDPLLLVLDEPTAALDAETEHAIFQRYAEEARAVRPRARTAVRVPAVRDRASPGD